MPKKIGLAVAGNIPLAELAVFTEKAEAAGFDSVWIHETYFMRDAITQLAVAAAHTKRIRLATGCINPYTRNTTVIAMTLATLNEFAPRRLILGLGTGYPFRLSQMGIHIHSPPLDLMKRVQEIRQLLHGNAILNGSKLMFTSSFTEIPVFIGGRKPGMLKITGRIADGYIAAPAESVQSLKILIQKVEDSAKYYGRKDRISVAANILTHVSKDADRGYEEARKDPFMVYMMSVMEDDTLLASGFELECKKGIAERYFSGRIQEASELVSDDMLDAFAVVGKKEEVIDKLEKFYNAGIDLPLILPIKTDKDSINSIIETGSAIAQCI
ncbi:MAG: LLM class flavin-dependent oxidoreductase [Conexivisphaerales archaeon]